jgi:hypothetical protein
MVSVGVLKTLPGVMPKQGLLPGAVIASCRTGEEPGEPAAAAS